MWPITGIPASTSFFTISAERTPPSSFTAPHPASFMKRAAFTIASCHPVW
jgi:hypothetical protein